MRRTELYTIAAVVAAADIWATCATFWKYNGFEFAVCVFWQLSTFAVFFAIGWVVGRFRKDPGITMLYDPNPSQFKPGDEISIAGKCYTVLGADCEHSVVNVYKNNLWGQIKWKLNNLKTKRSRTNLSHLRRH